MLRTEPTAGWCSSDRPPRATSPRRVRCPAPSSSLSSSPIRSRPRLPPAPRASTPSLRASPRRSTRSWARVDERPPPAGGGAVPDVIAPGLRVLFCGINPGLYSAAVGHHFARPGNRFWPALHRAGFTDRQLSPFDERELLERRIGVTNLFNFATANADELAAADLRRGGELLARKVRRHRPRIVAILGLGAYRLAFGATRVSVGRQERRIREAGLWALPNPSRPAPG